jgi:hypothetical protein
MSLIKTILVFKQYVAIDVNMKFASIEPYINEAEELYIVPLLGRAFYDEFVALYDASVAETPVALTPEMAALLPFIQRPLAYYAQLLAIPYITTVFGDMGIRTHRGEDSDPAPRWMIEKLQFQALKNGDLNADKLLAFLEENIAVEDYVTWVESSANTSNSGNIVYSTTIASRHIPINDSRRVFLTLRQKIREIESKSIPKLISAEQYAELVAQLQDIDPAAVTAANAALIAKLEPIICKRALYMQVPFMRVQINENGIFVYSGTDELFKLGQLATDADIKILRAQLMDEKELGYMADENELRQFILDNIANYPLIAASTAYTVQPDPGPTWQPLNDPNNNYFSV